MICPIRARDLMGDDTQAVGAGLVLRRGVGACAGRPGQTGYSTRLKPIGLTLRAITSFNAHFPIQLHNQTDITPGSIRASWCNRLVKAAPLLPAPFILLLEQVGDTIQTLLDMLHVLHRSGHVLIVFLYPRVLPLAQKPIKHKSQGDEWKAAPEQVLQGRTQRIARWLRVGQNGKQKKCARYNCGMFDVHICEVIAGAQG